MKGGNVDVRLFLIILLLLNIICLIWQRIIISDLENELKEIKNKKEGN